MIGKMKSTMNVADFDKLSDAEKEYVYCVYWCSKCRQPAFVICEIGAEIMS